MWVDYGVTDLTERYGELDECTMSVTGTYYAQT